MGKESFVLLYKSMVRSHLEFSDSVWSPYKVGLIDMLELVQPICSRYVNVTDRQTDRQTDGRTDGRLTIAIPR